jgi:endonuclease/exonuclease/phosphatase family metal-dependent hydrolase
VRFRVLSYNIHKGFTLFNRRFVLDAMRESIRRVGADFVFVQEIAGDRQLEYIADEIWPHFAYGRNAVYEGGNHGNAIMSKYPILAWENEDVSTTSIERRGLLHALTRLRPDGPELHLICAHFGLFERDRRTQARRLCARIRRTCPPGQALVAAGDFNDWALRLSPYLRREAGLQEAFHERHRRHARTFPARMPVFRLDRIYFQGAAVRLAKVLHGYPWTELSDHAPLLAEFEVSVAAATL